MSAADSDEIPIVISYSYLLKANCYTQNQEQLTLVKRKNKKKIKAKLNRIGSVSVTPLQHLTAGPALDWGARHRRATSRVGGESTTRPLEENAAVPGRSDLSSHYS